VTRATQYYYLFVNFDYGSVQPAKSFLKIDSKGITKSNQPKARRRRPSRFKTNDLDSEEENKRRN